MVESFEFQSVILPKLRLRLWPLVMFQRGPLKQWGIMIVRNETQPTPKAKSTDWLYFPGLSTDVLAHKHLPPDHAKYGHETAMVWHSHANGDVDHVHANPYKPEEGE